MNSSDPGLLKIAFLGTDADADFHSDGMVNVADLGVMKRDFFGAPGPSGLVNSCDRGRIATAPHRH